MVKQNDTEKNAKAVKQEIERLNEEFKKRTGEDLMQLASYIEGMKYVLYNFTGERV